MTSRTWTGQDRMLWRNFVMQNKNQTGSQSWQSLHQSFRKISPSMLQRTWSRCTCSLLNLSHPSTTDTYKLPGSALLPMLEVEMSKSWPKFVWCSEDLFCRFDGALYGIQFCKRHGNILLLWTNDLHQTFLLWRQEWGWKGVTSEC